VPARLQAQLRPALQKAGYAVQAAAADEMGDDQIIGVRSGTLRRALFTSDVVDTGTGLEVRVGADLGKAPYARVQEYGGTISAKNAAHLAIPLPAMLTGNGVARGLARDVIAKPQAFGYADTFTAKDVIFGTLGTTSSGRAKTRTMRDTGEIRTTVPLFALKESVELPARPYLSTGLQKSRDAITAILETAVQEALGG